MTPVAGSAYTYAYATVGEVFAWIVGWDLILEYALSMSTIAVGWSGYFVSLMRDLGWVVPPELTASPGVVITTAGDGTAIGLFNVPAAVIVVLVTALLVIGIKESANTNTLLVVIKSVVLVIFVVAGVAYVNRDNLTPFIPPNTGEFGHFGWSGILRGSAVMFFAYIGFDAVSTTAEEAKNPKRDLPIGIIASLVICTVLYLSVAAVLTGIIPVTHYRSNPDTLSGIASMPPEDTTKFLNAAVAFALSVIGQDWAAYLVSAGAVAGITSVLLVMLLSQPRIFFAMSRDGLLPPAVSRVHPRFGTPHITTIITCTIVAIVAGVTQINVVAEMTSIGTLFAFVVVCAAVTLLRIRRPDAHRPFKVPGGPYLFPLLGTLSCFYLMLALPVITWVRFLVWLDLGMIIYWFYGRRSSPLVNKAEATRRTGAQNFANFVTVFGALTLFNGIAMTILAYMTEFGITTETTAKWHEIGVTPEQADVVGFYILGTGLALFILGKVLTKATGESVRSTA